jgi:citrate synthase
VKIISYVELTKAQESAIEALESVVVQTSLIKPTVVAGIKTFQGQEVKIVINEAGVIESVFLNGLSEKTQTRIKKAAHKFFPVMQLREALQDLVGWIEDSFREDERPMDGLKAAHAALDAAPTRLQQFKALLESQDKSQHTWTTLEISEDLPGSEGKEIIVNNEQVTFVFDETGDKFYGIANWKE